MNSIVHLLDSICQIAATYKKIEATKGEKYNIFRVIDMTSNETSVHSAFLADLLNPNGLHQMGDVFLKLFINRFFNDADFKTENAKVEREKYIGSVTRNTGGRLDIIITDSTGKAIIIENKIYASDQENQLIRYYNYAQNLHSRYKLFYLSLDGIVHNEEKTLKDSDIHLYKDKDFYSISYESDILGWLEDCREKTADKPLIREGISHYINLIKYLTNQTINKEMEELMGLILDNPKYIKNLGIIKRAIAMSEIELQTRFWTSLEQEMKGKGYSIIKDGTYKYVFDEKEDRISGYYKGKPNNRRYGLEFMVGSYLDAEIRYAIRIDEPMVCGFFVTENNGKTRQISKDKTYRLLKDKITEELSEYKPDDAGFYLGVKNLNPNLLFKTMNPETLEHLADMDNTVSLIAESIYDAIEKIKIQIEKLF